MNLEEQLDKILETLAMADAEIEPETRIISAGYSNEIFSTILEEKLNKAEVRSLESQLICDGYIEPNAKVSSFFNITPKGIAFINCKGYVNQRIEHESEARQRKLMIMLSVCTVIVLTLTLILSIINYFGD